MKVKFFIDDVLNMFHRIYIKFRVWFKVWFLSWYIPYMSKKHPTPFTRPDLITVYSIRRRAYRKFMKLPIRTRRAAYQYNRIHPDKMKYIEAMQGGGIYEG